ncbi:Uncharacterised protein [Mycobacteroides abscessus subsp. massiliense]|nr:Uncharacterised protein [Mycobacteroides abscessus subsp. massiliense]
MVNPLYVSSIWAFNLPMLAHCATNSRCDRRAMVRVTHSDNGTVASVITASSGEILSIMASTATSVSIELSSWLMLICSDVWMLSTSLVTRLRISPRWRESKYNNGSRCILYSTSVRRATTVRCTVTFSSRACTHANIPAIRYRLKANARVMPIAWKSTPWPGMTFMPESICAN